MKTLQFICLGFLTFTLFSCYQFGPLSTKEQLIVDINIILNSEQKEQLSQLHTVEEIREFIDIFWSNLDPVPETAINELREEYEKRLKYVHLHYPYKRGWTYCDRARIYLLFGPPDDISFVHWFPIKNLPARDYKALEIWKYDTLNTFDNFKSVYDVFDPHLTKFVFVDFTGLGQYQLIYSNSNQLNYNPKYFSGDIEYLNFKK